MDGPRPVQKIILIIEDDPDVRLALSSVLAGEGYDVAEAGNGQEAIDHLQASAAPALILLDLMMPVMDGWQFRDRQRSNPSLTTIPVVVVSADGTVAKKAATIGAAGFLQKPVEIDQLLATVRRFC
jgi:CheY-like chemotaxis protein